MAKKFPAIPRSLILPGGFKVKTRLVTAKEMAKVDLKDAYAGWEGDISMPGGIIYIDKAYPYNSRWESYIHEMHHALTDWDHYIRYQIVTPFLVEYHETIKDEDEE